LPIQTLAHVLVLAWIIGREEYHDLGLADWVRIKGICRAVQPNAM
jgi:hypothetical protein